MISLKPLAHIDIVCPECHAHQCRNRDVLIEGVHAVADNVCLQCGFEFYQLLPVGHTVDYPIAYGKRNSVFYDNKGSWVTKGLRRYFEPARVGEITIRKVRYRTCRSVVILNALDFLYGHTLLKLLNCQYHLDHDSEVGLIVIIPAMFEWLLPEGCAEVWVVDMPLSNFHYRHTAIGEFVSVQLRRFDTVFLSRAYTHPDCASIDIRRFTGVAPFDLAAFSRVPVQVTFVLREDRFWVDHSALQFAFQMLRQIGLKGAGLRLLSFFQNRMVDRTIAALEKEFSQIKCVVVGLGRTGRIKKAADLRTTCVTTEVERDWCTAYAHSHLVVGIHGSNMILPTAHAAGCIEILPLDRVPNLVQDIAVRTRDRRQLFLYRFLHEFVKPSEVATHVVSMLKGYENFNTMMCRNQYPDRMMNIQNMNDGHHGQHIVMNDKLQ